MKTLRAVIFDMDGLMLDTERIVRRAWEAAGRDFGTVYCVNVFEKVIGRSVKDTRIILREAFGPEFAAEAFLERADYHYSHLVREETIDLKSGLSELLDFLEERAVPKAVATSTYRKPALFLLQKTNLFGRFQTVTTGNEVASGKPAPDIYLKAAQGLDIPPEDCLVLEDSSPGICAAAAAGMTPILVPDLIQPSEEARQLAFRVCASLKEVMALLKEGNLFAIKP